MGTENPLLRSMSGDERDRAQQAVRSALQSITRCGQFARERDRLQLLANATAALATLSSLIEDLAGV